MLPFSKTVKKQTKSSLQSTSKIAQQLLRKARLLHQPILKEPLSTITSARLNSKNNYRKQSMYEVETKPTISYEKSTRRKSQQKDKQPTKVKLEKKIDNCIITNGQSFSFHIDLSKLKKKDDMVDKQSFKYVYVIGKGGFGKVWWVESKKTGIKYAMKQMKKAKIIAKRSIHSVMNQRNLLATLHHPFIVNMNYAFQDRENLYVVLDLLTGGDFRYHLSCRRRFKQSEAKFYIGCIIIALQYLHSKNIIHRDIKPQNLVLDEKGFLKLTDLGVARQMKPNNSSDTSGTPGYMSPEVMCCQDHSFSSDYYAVGVILYQIILGKRPYNGKSRKEIRDHMLSKQVQIKQAQLPPGWSISAMNITNKLIQRNPQNRIGNVRIGQIKQHQWFSGFSWTNLSKRIMCAPFIPKPINLNHQYRQQISDSTQQDIDSQTLLMLRGKNVQELFEGYQFKPQIQDTKRETPISSSRQQSSRMLSSKIKSRNSSELLKR